MNDIAKRTIDPGRLTGGIIMITIGVLFLLSKLDIPELGQVVRRYWPMIVVLFGVSRMFTRETVWNGMWLVAVGSWLQVCRLRMFGLTYSTAWPLLLIALGAGMIARVLLESVRSGEDRHEA